MKRTKNADGIGKNFEITRTIYSNNESSDQFLKQNAFFNLLLEVSHLVSHILISIIVEQFKLKLKKFLVFRNTQEKLKKPFEILGWRSRICKCFEIARTIYSTSERSDQFLEQNAFLTCSLRILRSNNILKQLKLKLEKNYWDSEICRKS